MTDELAKAITRIVYPALKDEGFERTRKRDLVRVENGIAQLLYFQVSGWGGRDFCVTACVNLVAGNEWRVLQPGFRLQRDPDGADLWLPSLTAEEASRSAEIILEAIRLQALPYFAQLRSVSGFRDLLGKEQWGSLHHLSFQQGIAAALASDRDTARRHLADAIKLYEADGRDWCRPAVQKAQDLIAALADKREDLILTSWYEANKQAHGLR